MFLTSMQQTRCFSQKRKAETPTTSPPKNAAAKKRADNKGKAMRAQTLASGDEEED
jgi:hypothetical protein